MQKKKKGHENLENLKALLIYSNICRMSIKILSNKTQAENVMH